MPAQYLTGFGPWLAARGARACSNPVPPFNAILAVTPWEYRILTSGLFCLHLLPPSPPAASPNFFWGGFCWGGWQLFLRGEPEALRPAGLRGRRYITPIPCPPHAPRQHQPTSQPPGRDPQPNPHSGPRTHTQHRPPTPSGYIRPPRASTASPHGAPTMPPPMPPPLGATTTTIPPHVATTTTMPPPLRGHHHHPPTSPFLFTGLQHELLRRRREGGRGLV